MIRGYKVPTMILIDGLDGSGKNTISTQMRNILTDAGYRVFKLDSPDYDSPAGQMVMDNLPKTSPLPCSTTLWTGRTTCGITLMRSSERSRAMTSSSPTVGR